MDQKDRAVVIGLGLGLNFASGHSVAFSPKALAGLQAWYRADLLVTLNAGNVSAWGDSSGVGDSNRNALQASGAHQPPFNASSAGFNGKPTIGPQSSTVNLLMKTGAWSTPLAQPFTCFAVAKDYGGTGSWLFDAVSGGEVSINQHSASHARLYAGSFGADAGTAFGAATSLVGIFDSAHTNSKLYVSQNTPQAGANIGTDGFAALILGNSQSATGDGTSAWEIAELAFWNRVLTSGEIASLNLYASSRYGITIGP